MGKEDINADIEMYFRQILCLTDLMIECDNKDIPNFITIRDLAQAGLNKSIDIN